MFHNLITRRWPNIDHISGKGNGRETKEERERFTKESELDDKISVRKHLEPIIGIEGLPKLYYTGPVEKCDFKKIPLPFVIKTRCQCGNTKIVSSLDDIDSLINFYKNEWSYRAMNNDVIIEEKLDLNTDVFKDSNYHYELMTFGGRVKNILYHVSAPPADTPCESSTHWLCSRLLYYPNWTRNMLYPNTVMPMNVTIPKPQNLDKLINFTEKCAEYYCNYTTIPHVRISVYELENGKFVFGEYTGATTGGGGGGNEYQSQMSKWWREAAPNVWLK